jgi:hypothetical protein
MYGIYEYSVSEFGNAYNNAIPPSFDPLPGIYGLCLFGQPLWITNKVPVSVFGQYYRYISGSAIIVNVKRLPYSNSVQIAGSAIVQRNNNYFT